MSLLRRQQKTEQHRIITKRSHRYYIIIISLRDSTIHILLPTSLRDNQARRGYSTSPITHRGALNTWMTGWIECYMLSTESMAHSGALNTWIAGWLQEEEEEEEEGLVYGGAKMNAKMDGWMEG